MLVETNDNLSVQQLEHPDEFSSSLFKQEDEIVVPVRKDLSTKQKVFYSHRTSADLKTNTEILCDNKSESNIASKVVHKV
jgi:hypothetical protein